MTAKWHKGLPAAHLQDLRSKADEINTAMHDTITAVIRAKLKIGRLLLDARELFVGDKEFGQWRQDVLPDLSATEAGYCMQAARKYENAPALIEKVGWSALRELVYSPDTLIKELDDKAATLPEGDKLLSTSEARKLAKDLKDNGEAPETTQTRPGTSAPARPSGDVGSPSRGPAATVSLVVGRGSLQREIPLREADRMDVIEMGETLMEVVTTKGPTLDEALLLFGITDPDLLTQSTVLPTVFLDLMSAKMAEARIKNLPEGEYKFYRACYDKAIEHIKSIV